MFGLLREARTHAEASATAQELIARDLREQAYLSRLDLDGQGIQAKTDVHVWAEHAKSLAMLRKKHPELWKEVADAYDALKRSQRDGAYLPGADYLEDLAKRLEEASL